MIYEGDILATWDVGGENFSEMQDEAISDAEIFMEGFNPDLYNVFVHGAVPYVDSKGVVSMEGSKVTYWKGKAVVTWSTLSPQ